jgi:hypothetical protein
VTLQDFLVEFGLNESVPYNTFISEFARKSHTIEEAILQDVNDKFLQGFTSP